MLFPASASGTTALKIWRMMASLVYTRQLRIDPVPAFK